MSFKLTDRHIDQYMRDGFTVFERLIPPALLNDLRRSAEKARKILHVKHGPQAQRLQPIDEDLDDSDFQPFRDYVELPELREAMDLLLSRDHVASIDHIGILFEPVNEAYSTHWHRDWRDNIPGLDLSKWTPHLRDLRFFNQVNCALYEDSCTWVVPGSNLRHDLPAEVERFPDRPVPYPQLDGLAGADRESVLLDYCRSMPGAVRAHLDPGDYMIYQNSLWHIGCYVPYRRRATIHHGVVTPEYSRWVKRMFADARHRSEKEGIEWENPHDAGLNAAGF